MIRSQLTLCGYLRLVDTDNFGHVYCFTCQAFWMYCPEMKWIWFGGLTHTTILCWVSLFCWTGYMLFGWRFPPTFLLAQRFEIQSRMFNQVWRWAVHNIYKERCCHLSVFPSNTRCQPCFTVRIHRCQLFHWNCMGVIRLLEYTVLLTVLSWLFQCVAD